MRIERGELDRHARLPFFRSIGTAHDFQQGVSNSCRICSERWFGLSTEEQAYCEGLDGGEVLTHYLVAHEIGAHEPYLSIYISFLKKDGELFTGWNRHHYELKTWHSK